MKTVRIPALLLTAALLAGQAEAQTIVCVETNLDSFCMKLLQQDAPIATANFLSYVDSGAYTNTLIHQSVHGNYVVAGQYQVPAPVTTTTTDSSGNTTSTTTYSDLTATPVATNPPIPNEFKSANANVAYNVSFVVTPGQPGSTTSSFRINDADNSALFNSKTNSGAVFAQVIGDGKAVVDRLAHLSVHNLGVSYLSQAPMLQLDNKVTTDDLVAIKRIYRYAGTQADFDTYGINFPPTDTSTVNLADVTCLETTLGELCLQLFTADAPNTVANFLSYVAKGTYNNTVVHRMAKGSASDPLYIFQGGGYSLQNGQMTAVATASPIALELNKNSNVRGTIAMARTSDLNSATSQWFINYQDNTSLDTTGGGYAVFGKVISSSLATMDAISYLSTQDGSATYGSGFNEVPIIPDSSGNGSYTLLGINSVINTQRDVTVTSTGPTGPLAKVVTMGSIGTYYNGRLGARFPLRIGGKMYMVVLERYNDSTNANNPDNSDTSLYSIDLIRIVQLIDNGRIAATFDGNTLTIPTIRNGNDVFVNVQFQLVDWSTLKFRLQSYEQM